jgi:hypothetical protein
VSPAGKEPELIDHVYGVVPPFAESVAPYAELTCPLIRDVVVSSSGETAAATLILKDDEAVCGVAPASWTWTVNEYVPDCEGVPLITPDTEFNVSPAGNVPALIVQLYGLIPPIATRLVE